MEFKDFSLEPATSTFAFHFISISAARLECLAERDFNGDEEGGHFYVRDSFRLTRNKYIRLQLHRPYSILVKRDKGTINWCIAWEGN